MSVKLVSPLEMLRFCLNVQPKSPNSKGKTRLPALPDFQKPKHSRDANAKTKALLRFEQSTSRRYTQIWFGMYFPKVEPCAKTLSSSCRNNECYRFS